MNSKTILFFSVIFAFTLLSSCSTDDDKDHAFNYIDLEFYEEFSPESSFLNFSLSTVESFPCSNFTLEAEVNHSNGHTEIQVSDIDVPDICITTIGPATQLLQMGATDEASARYTFWVNDKRHEFEIIINDHHITLEQGSPFENHLLFNFDTLMRIPQNTVWGYAIFEQTSKEKNDLWNELMEAFKDAGAEDLWLEDGFYYYFSVTDNEIEFENIKQENITFHFQFDESLDVLTELFHRINEQYETEIQLRLFNTKGERFII